MTVGIRIKLPGLDQATFDKVNDHVDPAGDTPQGLRYHASGPIEGGWGVIDFWDSREEFDAFAPRIQAAVEAAGAQLAGPPDIKQFEVHETFPA